MLQIKSRFGLFAEDGFIHFYDKTVNQKNEVSDMTIGEKLKALRLSLGLNKKEFAHGIINSSYLASIEKGESEIRAIDLIEILQQHNLSIISFLVDFGDVKSNLAVYEHEADNAFFAQDTQRLIQIGNLCPNTLIKEVIQLMVAKLDGNLADFPKDIQTKIKKIFWKIEKWDINSLWILSNVMEIYSFDDLEGLVHSVFHNLVYFSDYEDETIKLLATITYNYLRICLTQVRVNEQEVKKASLYLRKIPSIPAVAYEKMKGDYILALHYSYYTTAEEIDKVLKKVREDELRPKN
ncbi:helix-turn-helix domain-containing protein [Lactobacillus helveticus]|uniref:helix-turn-helix domain-containing protein n=1 Tax=Lactobacillus helveticus TaxID=1587 RepID=UPI000A52248F|nr:helix-turn-helix transcriptional regulator [Lactobacillus helveticus]